jgi:hypothetical protein
MTSLPGDHSEFLSAPMSSSRFIGSVYRGRLSGQPESLSERKFREHRIKELRCSSGANAKSHSMIMSVKSVHCDAKYLIMILFPTASQADLICELT